MTPCFADTFYFQARVNRHDQHHARVLAWSQTRVAPLVTTDLVLVELANSLAASRFRPLVHDYFALLRRTVTVVPLNRSRWENALMLYHQHDDKSWSLTDCLSFVVMRERRISEALTGDRHFVQAGFAAVFAQKQRGVFAEIDCDEPPQGLHALGVVTEAKCTPGGGVHNTNWLGKTKLVCPESWESQASLIDADFDWR